VKIGVFLDSYRAEDGGGYTMQSELFRALLRNHQDAKHEFVIISRPDQAIRDAVEDSVLTWLPVNPSGFIEKIGEFIIRSWPKLRGRFKWHNSVERKARRAGIEYIWFLGPRAHFMDLPYLTIVLDLQHRKQPWFSEVRDFGEWEIRERLTAPFLRRAAGIIAGTRMGKEEITKFYQVPEDQIYLLPHPTPDYISVVSADESTLKRRDLVPGYLFYPAQFWAHKNHVNLLIAIKQLKDKGLKIPLVLTGSDFGNQDFVRKKINQLGLDDQVKFLGFVEPPELISLYQNALALTYLSYFGPENLPPLEAFALGCPVIAAKVDGAEEQIGDSGLLVDPSSPEEIAGAIRRVHEDIGLRSTLITRGRERAAGWTSDDFVKGVFKILDEFDPIRRNWGV
jgi:glycosyltransferase involved in cell wall biosynthesis